VEDRELKKVYYALVKKLHPDVNPTLSDGQRRLWTRVQAAYELSDLAELKALALLAHEPASELPPLVTIETLRRDQEVLREQIETILKRLEQWEGQPPFTLRAQLEDEAWLAQRREEIETRIAQLDAQRASLEAQLRTLFPDESHGTIFGLN
jgi:curved DNA-binding protein CbpA